jgi:NAD(P)H-dependent flavin oxidoreductase YrpB (nitropropane dioxygenase family)
MLAFSRHTPAAAIAEIDDVLGRTNRPVGATLLALFATPELVDAVAERVPVLEMFWSAPDAAFVRNGVIVGWQVGDVDEAKAAVDLGCQYVIAQGVEAGGHVRGTMPLHELIPRVRDAIDVPLVAAGGIGTRADVARALALGADAVRVGTRFVAAAESAAHEQYVAMLSAATAADTVMTETFSLGWENAPHRVLASCVEAAQKPGPDPVGAMTAPDGSQRALERFNTSPPTTTTTGQIEAMALYAGTGVDAVHGRVPAAAIVAELTDGLDIS